MTRIVETRSTEVARDAVHTEGMRRVQQSRGGGAASVRPHTASGVDCLERGVATNGVRHAAVGAAEAPVASPLAEIVQGHLPGDLVARVVGEAVGLDQDLSPDAGLLLRLAETAAGASALGEPEAALAERLCAAMGNIRKGMMLTLSDGVGAYTTADTKVPRSLVAACGEALATEKAEGKTVALQQVMLKNKAQFPFGMDINAFVQAVLRESYLLQNEILKDYADKVKFYTEQKKRIRAELQRARSTLANTAGMDDSAKLLEPFTPTDLSQVYGGGAENDEATDELGRAGAEKGSSNGSDSADPLPPAAPLLDDVANGYQATSAERILPVDASRTTYEVHTPSLGGSQTVDGYGLSPAQIQALLTQGKTVGIPYNGEYVLLTQEEGGSPAATYKGLPIVVELAADNSILKLKGLPGLDAAAQWVQVDSGGTLTKVEKDTTSTVTGTQERSFSSEYSWSEYDKLEDQYGTYMGYAPIKEHLQRLFGELNISALTPAQRAGLEEYFRVHGLQVSITVQDSQGDQNTYDSTFVARPMGEGESLEDYIAAVQQDAYDHFYNNIRYDQDEGAIDIEKIDATVNWPTLQDEPAQTTVLGDTGGVLPGSQDGLSSPSDTSPGAASTAGQWQSGEPILTKSDLDAYVKNLEDELNVAGDDAQLANVDLQNAVQIQQQTLQMMSNISKALHDTALSIIRKIGG